MAEIFNKIDAARLRVSCGALFDITMATKKEKLARSVFERAKELGIKMTVSGSWVRMDGDVPTDLIVDSAECADELAALVKNGA